MRRFTWRDQWYEGTNAESVDAEAVEFTRTHVVWRDASGNVVQAVRSDHVHHLTSVPVDA